MKRFHTGVSCTAAGKCLALPADVAPAGITVIWLARQYDTIWLVKQIHTRATELRRDMP